MMNSLNAPFSAVHPNTLSQAHQYTSLLATHRATFAAEQAGFASHDPLGSERKYEDPLENHDKPLKQGLISETALGALSGALGTLGEEAVKHLPDILSWFKTHHGAVHNIPPPPDLTWQNVKWGTYTALQYAIPAIQGALIVWYISDPNQNVKLYIAGFGVIVQFFINHGNNGAAKSLAQAELDYSKEVVSGQAFNLGLVSSNPEFMAQAGITQDHLEGLMAQVQANSKPRWSDWIFNGCCTPTLNLSPQRSWFRQLTDCCGCLRACKNIFRSENKNPDIALEERAN